MTNERLFTLISASYCVLIVLANIISVKMMPLTDSFSIPIGLLISPVTFLLCALTTELFGAKQARMMVFTALSLMLLSIGVIQGALFLPNSDLANQEALQATLGLSPLILFSSLAGYAISQLLEISLYASIRRFTGEPLLWLRNSGSVLISQAADTAIVNSLYLAWGLSLPFEEVTKVIIFAYFYKLALGMLSTPMLYFFLAFFKSVVRVRVH